MQLEAPYVAYWLFCDYVKSIDYTDNECITLIGCSQGGLVSALLASERESEIERIVLCYPALSTPDDARKGSMLGAKFTSDNLPEKLRALYVKLGRAYIESALAIEPCTKFAHSRSPYSSSTVTRTESSLQLRRNSKREIP